MSVTINAKGTSVPFFKIGKSGITLFQGFSDPTGSYSVANGDYWFDSTSGSMKARIGGTWAAPKLNQLTFPSGTGSNGQTLVSDGSGNLSFSAAGTGTVTDVSVVSANGLAGTVATSTTTPAITLSTTVTGVVKGNGTALSAASSSDIISTLGYTPVNLVGDTMTGNLNMSADIVLDNGKYIRAKHTDGTTIDRILGISTGDAVYIGSRDNLLRVKITSGGADNIVIAGEDLVGGTTGYVGIGVQSPLQQLHVGGNLLLENYDANITFNNLDGLNWELLADRTTGQFRLVHIDTSGPTTIVPLSVTSSGAATFLNAVTATTFIGALQGNADTATTLATARNISASGDATWTVSFDGSANTTSALTLATVNSSPQTDTFRKVTVNGKGLITATSAVTATDITSVLTYTPVNLAGDTMSGPLILNADPTNLLGAVTKQYADGIAAGVQIHASCETVTTSALATCTYNNGTAGVGATLTCNTNIVLGTIGGYAGLVVGSRLLVKDQVSTVQNGIYTVTSLGSAGVSPWILTRSTDLDGSPTSEVQAGDMSYVQEGTLGGTQWIVSSIGTGSPNDYIIVGTNPIVWTQFAGAGTYVQGSGVNISTNVISNTGVLSNIAGTGISVSGATGNVTVSNTGVISIAGTANQITSSASSGAVTLSLPSTITGLSSVTSTTFVGALTGASSLNVLKSGDTMTGTLDVNVGGGTASTTHGLSVINGAGNGFLFISKSTVGGWNTLVQANDASIIAQSGGAADGTTGIVIGPWSASAKGIRIDGSGNVSVGGATATARLDSIVSDAGTTNIPNSIALTHTTSGTAANNFGVGMQFVLQDAAGSLINSNRIASAWTNAAAGERQSALVFYSQSANAQSEAMRIDSTGKVGIGTFVPTANLHVESATTASALVKSTATTSTEFSEIAVVGNDATLRLSAYGSNHTSRSNTTWLNANTSTPLVFSTVNAERMRIDTSGNLGIGTASPSNRLHVKSTTVGNTAQFEGPATSDSCIDVTNSGVSNTYIGTNNSGSTNVSGVPTGCAYVANGNGFPLVFATGSAARVRIDASGNVGIGRTSSGSMLEVAGTIANVVAASGDAVIAANVNGVTNMAIGCNDTASTNAYQAPAWTNYIGSSINRPMVFSCAAERMRIDTSGNLGIGITTPAAKLHAHGGLGVLSTSTSFPGPTQQISARISGDSVGNGTDVPGLDLRRWDGSATQHWATRIGMDAANAGSLVFMMDSKSTNTVATTERMRITSTGSLVVGGATGVQGIITAKGTIAVMDSSESYLGQFSATTGVTTISAYSGPGQALAFNTTPSGSGSIERMRITSTGQIYGTAIHNNSAGAAGTTNQYIASGTYTPTATAGANVTAASSAAAQWMRVGNVVTVSGYVFMSCSTQNASTQLGISIPVASTFSSATQAAGTAATNNGTGFGAIMGDTTNSRVTFTGTTINAGTNNLFYTFTYQVL